MTQYRDKETGEIISAEPSMTVGVAKVWTKGGSYFMAESDLAKNYQRIRIVDDTLVVVDESAAADLPTLEIPVSRYGGMKLWCHSAAFREELASTVFSQDWGIAGIEGMLAPEAGTARNCGKAVFVSAPLA